MPGRTFTTTDHTTTRVDPLWFVVEGVEKHRVAKPQTPAARKAGKPLEYDTVESKFSIRFDCTDDMPSGVLIDFMAAGDDDARSADGILTFMRVAVQEEQREEWDRLLRDPARIVPIETMGEIAEYLADEFNDSGSSGRPTPPPARSSRGHANTRRMSGR